MSDGQSFYLVLALFYLLECVKLAPASSLGLVSLFGPLGSFSPRPQLLMAWGLGKSVFLAPILPVPGLLYLLPSEGEKNHASAKRKSASSIRHHHRFLVHAARRLRVLALLNFLNFFLILPVVYVRLQEETIILYTLGYCYATLLLTAFHYHRVHQRLFPRQKADRLKTTLYTALLPWHAARCPDEIFIKASQTWSPLAALAANTAHTNSRSLLQRHWREAHFKAKPAYKRDTLANILQATGIEFKTWLDAPTDCDSPFYCPCCLNNYEIQATHCTDCQGVPLAAAPLRTTT